MILLCLFSTGEVPATYQLVSVHVVIRHGDRTPLHTLPGYRNKMLSCRMEGELFDTEPVVKDFVRTMRSRGRRKPGQSYSIMPTFPDADSCEVGSLTPLGALQHLHNGLFLRDRYISRLQLITPVDGQFTGQVPILPFATSCPN